MKTKLFLVALGAGAILTSCNTTSESSKSEAEDGKMVSLPASIKTANDSAAFYIGTQLGAQLKQSDMSDLSLSAIQTGVEYGMKGKQVNPMEAQMFMQKFMQKKQAEMMAKRDEQAKANLAEGQKFLEKTKAEAGVDTLSNGILYKVIKKGEGAMPVATDQVKVHYEGRLIDGTVFDSSIERGEPTEFPLNQVIKGWTIALQHMAVGSKWTIYLPAEVAYGVRGAGDKIGPNATLIFDVELLDITTPKATEEAKK